ncbi:hypothetical protein [Sinisalibacter lacisalsi]|uniref:Lipoprotein n=1 Tax=Sinisalibacter lacisalsi TaxID=1526570 RepID=A0ABQ1QCY0_9RHOB|nr:hypothetical protein [Sinisalibacter lacisalsi]GGD23428.1 hypothetical protein GCM10011358_04880 [Sinisalibacter lacisalsi]
MRRITILLITLLGLSACAMPDPVWAPDEAVDRARVSSSGAPTLTLFSVINVKSGNGGHSGLLVSAPSERVLFDPAGSFQHPRLPERHDVLHGMTDAAVDFYIDYHSRESWRVVRQEISVPAAVAEQALALAKANGPVPNAFCTNSITAILSELPGFESIRSTMFPENLQADFAKLPGVSTREYHDNDPDNNGYILARGI